MIPIQGCQISEHKFEFNLYSSRLVHGSNFGRATTFGLNWLELPFKCYIKNIKHLPTKDQTLHVEIDNWIDNL